MGEPKKKIEILSADHENQKARALSPALVTAHYPLSVAAEAYRMLRTNLFYSQVDAPPKVVVVTSAGPREGKSVTCANLGVTLAQSGKSVLLLDGDLRKPIQHKIFGLDHSPGLVDVLAGECATREAWQEPILRLKVLPAGHAPPNSAEILGSRRFTEFLVRARQEFDYVLLDTPPARLVSDSTVLARHGDGVLLVLDINEASKRSLRHTMKILAGVGANVIGTVTNNVKISKKDDNYGYIARYYGG